MGRKRESRSLRRGEIIDVLECHDGRYGAKGMPRQKRKKATKEEMVQANLRNKARLCRLKMLEYIEYGDYFGTWTYRVEERPDDMAAAKKDLAKCLRRVRAFYKKKGYELFYFRNIEVGTKGAWHIHFVVNRIEGAAQALTEAWEHGGTYLVQIKNSKFYDEDFTMLANYMTKNQNSVYYNQDGSRGKPRIREASYWTSKNMPLPEPKKEKLRTWPSEIKPKKGYYIMSKYEGINPVTGFMYRRYTMRRIRGDDKRCIT